MLSPHRSLCTEVVTFLDPIVRGDSGFMRSIRSIRWSVIQSWRSWQARAWPHLATEIHLHGLIWSLEYSSMRPTVAWGPDMASFGRLNTLELYLRLRLWELLLIHWFYNSKYIVVLGNSKTIMQNRHMSKTIVSQHLQISVHKQYYIPQYNFPVYCTYTLPTRVSVLFICPTS